MERLQPDVRFIGLHKRPRTEQPALHNIEKALAVIWKKPVRAKNMPTAKEIYSARSDKVILLVREIFEAFVMRAIRARLREMLAWYSEALAFYGLALPHLLGPDAPAARWQFFSSGVAIACVLHHHPSEHGAIDLSAIHAVDHDNPEHVRHNVAHVFDCLVARGIPLFWTVDEFMAHPDDAFLLFQLNIIWLELRDQPVDESPKAATFADESLLEQLGPAACALSQSVEQQSTDLPPPQAAAAESIASASFCDSLSADPIIGSPDLRPAAERAPEPFHAPFPSAHDADPGALYDARGGEYALADQASSRMRAMERAAQEEEERLMVVEERLAVLALQRRREQRRVEEERTLLDRERRTSCIVFLQTAHEVWLKETTNDAADPSHTPCVLVLDRDAAILSWFRHTTLTCQNPELRPAGWIALDEIASVVRSSADPAAFLFLPVRSFRNSGSADVAVEVRCPSERECSEFVECISYLVMSRRGA